MESLDFFVLLIFAYFSSSTAIFKPSFTNDFFVKLDSNVDGIFWRVINNDSSINVPAVVPGNIYSDLHRSGIIDDPFFRFNDAKSKWVTDEIWTYSTKFYLSEDQIKKNAVTLVAHGLDTVASIRVNGHFIASTDNMFLKHTFAIKKYIKDGLNELTVSLESGSRAAAACPPPRARDCHAPLLRKMQASFGWDYAPALLTLGIWKPMHVHFYNGATIEAVSAQVQLLPGHKWEVRLRVRLAGARAVRGRIDARINIDTGEMLVQARNVKTNTKKAEHEMVFVIKERDVSMWWPNGYGNQTLYTVRVSYQDSDFPNEHFYTNVQLGFKTLELIQDAPSRYLPENNPGSTKGLTFYFKVNGYPIFMKGANWNPVNILPDQTYNRTLVDWSLSAARAAHATMVRVRGEGVYESDYFYTRCDELGLLVWQELPFAAASYPADEGFINSVREEVRQNVERIQSHVSLGLWVGNSDVELSMYEQWSKAADLELQKSNYERLFVNTIKPLIHELDPNRPFVTSSPSRGLLSEAKGNYLGSPNDFYSGDTHHYGYYGNGVTSLELLLPPTRFSSDYGILSLPSLETLAQSTDKIEDYKLYSKYSMHRQRDLMAYESMLYRVNETLIGRVNEEDNYYGKYVFYSQIAQALALKAESEFYRQSRADWYTMGALYSQLNDAWPAPTRATIEYGGRWKMAQYFAMNFFSPILISPRVVGADVFVYLINDRLHPIHNASIVMDTFRWTDLKSIQADEYLAKVNALSTDKYDLNFKLDRSLADRFYRFSFLSEEGNLLSPYNYYFPTKFNAIENLVLPEIEIHVRNVSKFTPTDNWIPAFSQTFVVEIRSKNIILFLWLETPTVEGHFLENGLVITEPVTEVIFMSYQLVSKEQLQTSIKYKYYLQ